MENSNPIISKRVPRFVEEYAKDRNGTQAAIRAGYSPNGADVTACRLLADPRIQALIVEEQARITAAIELEVSDVLREWLDIATADPSKIMYTRRVNCRHCHGVGHEYQWGAREYAEACDRALKHAQKNKEEAVLPDCAGGFGWRHNAEPVAGCPECGGEGLEDLFFCDTEKLTGKERKLIAGIKRTKDGLEVKMRDQDAAVANLAKYLGMLVEKRELTGKNGRPLIPTAIPENLPTDADGLASLYREVIG